MSLEAASSRTKKSKKRRSRDDRDMGGHEAEPGRPVSDGERGDAEEPAKNKKKKKKTVEEQAEQQEEEILPGEHSLGHKDHEEEAGERERESCEESDDTPDDTLPQASDEAQCADVSGGLPRDQFKDELAASREVVKELERKNAELESEKASAVVAHKSEAKRLRDSRVFKVSKERVRVEATMVEEVGRRFDRIRAREGLPIPDGHVVSAAVEKDPQVLVLSDNSPSSQRGQSVDEQGLDQGGTVPPGGQMERTDETPENVDEGAGATLGDAGVQTASVSESAETGEKDTHVTKQESAVVDKSDEASTERDVKTSRFRFSDFFIETSRSLNVESLIALFHICWYKPDVIKGEWNSIRPDVLDFFGTEVIDESHDQDTTDLDECTLYICNSTLKQEGCRVNISGENKYYKSPTNPAAPARISSGACSGTADMMTLILDKLGCDCVYFVAID
ncbi:hypothetical protein Bca52824_001260 [Brassica carinata]|uniref:Uncharacterized protein n=1 Tax=Brassica carinata TaxID=52824 RepID=A0A8X7WJ24_BRACI|nr:hypothetical protein Bca52824_001260 [Brassica carinata]